MSKKNDADDNFESLDEIFNQDWFDGVDQAIMFAMLNADKLNVNTDTLPQQIIDYNITKRLREVVLENLVDTLPKTLNWTNKPIFQAFEEFKDIVDSCDICPNFNKYTVKIICGDSKLLQNSFIEWKDIVNEHYPSIALTIEQMKTKNHFKLQVMRI